MRTTTITFHASHNYGSMLQAYALQHILTDIYGHNEILNFRSERQKRMMRVITLRPRLGPLLKDLTHLLYFRSLCRKHRLFEEFVHNCLVLSKSEISTVNAEDLNNYDLIICGSDQIWNPFPEDFDISYLLPFEIKAKKISYAVSMGPTNKVWCEPISQYPRLIKAFDGISVREVGTQTTVEKLTGRNDVVINCDPVLLLDKSQWTDLIDSKPIIKGKYVFLYTLYASPLIVNCAKVLSKRLGLPVIISNFSNIHDLFAPFKKHLASGPKEFLNLLYNSEFVITSSFHGTAFSILLNKPFVSIKGMEDNRIGNLLRICKLECRSVSDINLMKSISLNTDFKFANRTIDSEREKALDYLSRFKV